MPARNSEKGAMGGFDPRVLGAHIDELKDFHTKQTAEQEAAIVAAAELEKKIEGLDLGGMDFSGGAAKSTSGEAMQIPVAQSEIAETRQDNSEISYITDSMKYTQAQETYTREVHDRKHSVKNIEKAKAALVKERNDLLLGEIRARQGNHPLLPGSTSRGDTYEREVEVLLGTLFTQQDSAPHNRDLMDALIGNPDLLQLIGKQALSHVGEHDREVLTTILVSPSVRIHGDAPFMEMAKREFDAARTTYLSQYYAHCQRLAGEEVRETTLRTGLNRHKIDALSGERKAYEKARTSFMQAIRDTANDPEKATEQSVAIIGDEERAFIRMREEGLSHTKRGFISRQMHAFSQLPPVVKTLATMTFAGGLGVAGAFLAGKGTIVMAGIGLQRMAVAFAAGSAGPLVMQMVDWFRKDKSVDPVKDQEKLQAAYEKVFSKGESEFTRAIEQIALQAFKNENRENLQKEADYLKKRIAMMLVSMGLGAAAASVHESFTASTLAPLEEPSAPITPNEAVPQPAPPEPLSVESNDLTPSLDMGSENLTPETYADIYPNDPQVYAGEGAIETFERFFSTSPTAGEFLPLLKSAGIDVADSTALSENAASVADTLSRKLGFLTSTGESPTVPEGSSFGFNEKYGLIIYFPDGTSQELLTLDPKTGALADTAQYQAPS